MFGDKYGEKVRVVSIGAEINKILANPEGTWALDNSVEFCGGTHVKNVKEMFRFMILSEEPISKGIRRITCCTGADAVSRAGIRATQLFQELGEAKTLQGALLDNKVTQMRQMMHDSSDISLLVKNKLNKDVRVFDRGF